MNNFHNNNEELIISLRQVQLFAALCLFGAFTFFALGYFFGQRHALKTLVENATTTAISDEIRTNFYHQAASEDLSKPSLVQQDKKESHNDLVEADQTSSEKITQNLDGQNVSLAVQPPVISEQLTVDTFYAPLVGFGTEKAAQSFMQRWSDSPVRIKTQVSRNTKGKEITWYQIVTKPFTDTNELKKFVTHIQKKERLKDPIKIIPIKS